MLGNKISPNRNRFTVVDLNFVASVIAPNEQRQHLEKLWKDSDAQREMLDLKEILRGLLESPFAIQVSAEFYFYVLVRHSFVQADLRDAGLADYVSGVMTRGLRVAAGDPLLDLVGGFTHAADFISIISTAKGRLRYHLQVAAGNRFLVLTGLYPEFLKTRNHQCGGPDLGFYESFAQKAYRSAAQNKDAPGAEARQMFGNLSEALPVVRRSLNRMAEELVFLGD